MENDCSIYTPSGEKKEFRKKWGGGEAAMSSYVLSKQNSHILFILLVLLSFTSFKIVPTLRLLKKKKKITYFDIITGSSTDVTERLYSGKLLSAH